MDNSNLTFLPLGETKTKALPANCVALNIAPTTKNLSFSKETSELLKEGEYNFLKVGINKYSSEVYFIFCKKSEMETMVLGFGKKGRLTIAVPTIIEALVANLGIEPVSQRLKLSSDLSKTSDYVTYKVSKW